MPDAATLSPSPSPSPAPSGVREVGGPPFEHPLTLPGWLGLVRRLASWALLIVIVVLVLLGTLSMARTGVFDRSRVPTPVGGPGHPAPR